MGDWIAGQLHEQCGGKPGRALVLGITFKENVPDIRNSKAIDVVEGLRRRGHEVALHDPLADPVETRHEYGLMLDGAALDASYNLVLAAVPHDQYRRLEDSAIRQLVAEDGLLADLKGIWRDRPLSDVRRWSL
jgi:UDP-N-acetyl-D-galactosamine dehydrogenase